MGADRRPVHIRAKYLYPMYLHIQIKDGMKHDMILKSDKQGEIMIGSKSSIHRTLKYFTLIPTKTWDTFTNVQFCFRAENSMETECEDIRSAPLTTEVYREHPEKDCTFHIHPIRGCQLRVKLHQLVGEGKSKGGSLGVTISGSGGVLGKYDDSVEDQQEYVVDGYVRVNFAGPRTTKLFRIAHRSDAHESDYD
ncbi:unnamed protein product [Calicophoron daubneyi]|uniref:Uncharacterized protein n=1 Tax=Calicophoron daubneyi TaxID=300641 RepID=A0AAV2TMS1_CALDB